MACNLVYKDLNPLYPGKGEGYSVRFDPLGFCNIIMLDDIRIEYRRDKLDKRWFFYYDGCWQRLNNPKVENRLNEILTQLRTV
jgi:hypothetical protein